jgi:hypothetical protein
MSVLPLTATDLAGSGLGAGPACTEPSPMLNWLPWQGHMIRPPATLPTVQPWCVQVALKALKVPAAGWVTTTLAAEKILPPPTGTSEVLPSGVPAGVGAGPPPVGLAPVGLAEVVCAEVAAGCARLPPSADVAGAGAVPAAGAVAGVVPADVVAGGVAGGVAVP